MKKIKLGVIALLALTAILLAACGGGGEPAAEALAEDDPEAQNARQVDLIATNFKFDQDEYRVKQGEAVKFTLVNEEGMHALSIKGLGVDLRDGESAVIIPKKAGTYSIICTLPCGSGHSTMRSTLIVE